MSESMLHKKWLPLALVLGCLALGAAGWFGYSLWAAAAKAQAGWRLANEDMRELLLEQAEAGGAAKPAAAAKAKAGSVPASDPAGPSGASQAASGQSTEPAVPQPGAVSGAAAPLEAGGGAAAAASGAPAAAASAAPGTAGPNEAGASPPAASASAGPADESAAAAAAGTLDPKPSQSSAAPAAQSSAQAGGRINLNTATAGQLTAIPGIGDSKAKAILDYRVQQGGRFQSVEQLLEVKGIGDKLLAKMRPYVTVAP